MWTLLIKMHCITFTTIIMLWKSENGWYWMWPIFKMSKSKWKQNHFPFGLLLLLFWLYKDTEHLRANQSVYAFLFPQGIEHKKYSTNSTPIDQSSYLSIGKKVTELHAVFNELLMHSVLIYWHKCKAYHDSFAIWPIHCCTFIAVISIKLK